MASNLAQTILFFDDRRDLVFPGNAQQTLLFAAEQFLHLANAAIKEKGKFYVALSGGSTPKALFQLLSSSSYKSRVAWEHVVLFWSDERNVSKDSSESNYKMAMDAGFSSLPIPGTNIHPMPAEGIEIDEAAQEYEKLILEIIPKGSFDLVMLGMGEDGHTASLFPKTHGLHSEERIAIANFVPLHNSWRMTLTFKCINEAQHISIYVIGKNKASMLKRILSDPQDPDELPIQNIGTRTHKALWIVDNEAASQLLEPAQNL